MFSNFSLENIKLNLYMPFVEHAAPYYVETPTKETRTVIIVAFGRIFRKKEPVFGESKLPNAFCARPSSGRSSRCDRGTILPHHESLPGPRPDHVSDRSVSFVKDVLIESKGDLEASKRIVRIDWFVQADNVLTAIITKRCGARRH